MIKINMLTEGKHLADSIFGTNGDPSYVKAHITQGADVNQKNNSGLTPLYLAIFYNYIQIVHTLIHSGADVNLCVTGYEISPLCLAASNGNIEIVRMLIRADADVNHEKLSNGETPLYEAAKYDHLETVKILLMAGADVDIELHDNLNIFDLDLDPAIEEVLDIFSSLEPMESVEPLKPSDIDPYRSMFAARIQSFLSTSPIFLKVKQTIFYTFLAITKYPENSSIELPELPCELWVKILNHVSSLWMSCDGIIQSQFGPISTLAFAKPEIRTSFKPTSILSKRQVIQDRKIGEISF